MIRHGAWLTLAIAAGAAVAVGRSRRDRNTAAFIVLGALCLFAASLIEDVVGSRWIAFVSGIACWFVGGTSFTLIAREIRRRAVRPLLSLDSLQETYLRLHHVPSTLLDQKALKVLAALPADTTQFAAVGDLSHRLVTTWQEVWIISALLNEIGLVRLVAEQPLRGSHVALTVQGARTLHSERRARTTEPDVHLPPITVLNSVVVQEGGTIVQGDNYTVSGTNVTGAFGHNKVRDISSQASGGQSATVRDVLTEARALAERIPSEPAQELRDVSTGIEDTSDESDLRRKMQRLIGIAALLGNQGQPLLDLARKVIESIAH